TGLCGVVGGWGDAKGLGDRLDSPPQPCAAPVLVLVDEPDHFFDRRSSSAPKKDAAAFKMSLARRSSAFSRFNRFNSANSSLVGPARRPVSRSAWRTQFLTVSGVGPNFSATDVIASHATRTHAHDRAPSAPPAHAARPGISHVLA